MRLIFHFSIPLLLFALISVLKKMFKTLLVNFLNLFNLFNNKKKPIQLYLQAYTFSFISESIHNILDMNNYKCTTILDMNNHKCTTLRDLTTYRTWLTISTEIYLHLMIRHFLFTIFFQTAEINVDNSIELEQQNVSK